VAEKGYIIPYSRDARKRHYHKTFRGKVVEFMVQLEIRHEDNWKEVVRYDCAHGYAHCDSYSMTGKMEKDKLYFRFEDALTLSDDIDDNSRVTSFRAWERRKLGECYSEL